MSKRRKETFQGELLLGHKGAAVEVPFDPDKKWAIKSRPLRPGRRGHTVQCELRGVKFVSCIVGRSRRFWLLIDRDIQRAAGVTVGDRVRITVEPGELNNE